MQGRLQQHFSLKIRTVGVKSCRCDIQLEAQTKQEVHLKKVHLCCADPSNSSIIGIVVIYVIHELCRDQDAGDEQAVDIEGIDGQQWLRLSEAVEVDVGNDEARGAAICVLEDPLEVAVDCNGGCGEAVEKRQPLGRLEPPAQIVGFGHSLEN